MEKRVDKALPNLHTITVIVCLGSACAELHSSLYICFSVSAFSYGNWGNESQNKVHGCADQVYIWFSGYY